MLCALSLVGIALGHTRQIYWHIFLSAYDDSILTVTSDTKFYDAVSDSYLTPEQIQNRIEDGKDVVLSNCIKDNTAIHSCVIAHVIDSVMSDGNYGDNNVHGYLIQEKQ